MQTLLQDLRYAVRILLKKRGFATVALITLALGIGANTAIFSAVNAVLLRPLPYFHPEQIVLMRDKQPPDDETPTDYPEFVDWKQQNGVFQEVAAYFNTAYTMTGRGEPEQLFGCRVSSNLFPTLGVTPVLGRNISLEEERPGSQLVALISYGLWQRRFGADPAVLGTTMTLDARAYTIVGVLPQSFRSVRPIDASAGDLREVWAPLRLDASRAPRGLHFLSVIGRLRDGVGLDQARREMSILAERLKQERSINHDVQLHGLKDSIVKDSRSGLLLLLAAVGFVLLIGCANVANLLLARASARQKEIAIRLAIGASRRRLIRQLLTESILLALIGGGLGLLVSLWLMNLIADLARSKLPRIEEIDTDWRVLLFTLAVSLGTGILFGLWPALRAVKMGTYEILKEGGAVAGAAHGRDRARGFLVISEMALSLVLLIAAGLMISSFVRLLQVPKGFDPGNIVTFGLSLSGTRYAEPAMRARVFDQVLERMSSLPGIEAAGAVNDLPLAGGGTNGGFSIEGQVYPPDSLPVADKRIASEGYFEAMRIPLIKGRFFAARDIAGAPQVAIVNEAFVRRFLADEEPIGKRIDFRWDTTGLQEIVGVVRDIRHEALGTPPVAEIYVPFRQATPGSMSVALRTPVDPFAVAGAVREQIYAVDKEQAIGSLRSMDQLVSESVSPQRLSILLYGGLAGLALVLAAVGIYGVISYSVTERRHEIGIRLALGAKPSDVLKLVVGQGMRLALIGVGIGLAAAFAVTRVMASLLFEVGPTDPATFIIVPVLLAGVALGACFLPARRATKVDPMAALRGE
ncbi:MAG: ABC transporter permease [Acidobacteriota bacterium]